MEKDLEKLSYKEALRLVIKMLDEQGERAQSLDSKFNALDARELLLQKAMERLLGKLEGKKEEGINWRWKAGFVLSIAGFISSIIISIIMRYI